MKGNNHQLRPATLAVLSALGKHPPASIVEYLRSLKRYLRVPETGIILGRHKETIRQMCASGEIVAYKQGRDWLIDPIKLADWLESGGADSSPIATPKTSPKGRGPVAAVAEAV